MIDLWSADFRGFGGFSRIQGLHTDLTDFHGFRGFCLACLLKSAKYAFQRYLLSQARIRKICVNPPNPCCIKHLLSHWLRGLAGSCRGEVCTLVNSGRVTSINAERGSLGTDKSVPYKKPANALNKHNI
ncbi:MAG: hypothetical protein FWG87_13555 [Defluviitaleaceae bacterium]|nr:hypothetical protein [Defluviitaleaceae bacterium]